MESTPYLRIRNAHAHSTTSPGLQMSFSPPGAVAGRRRWMSMSFPLSSSRPWGRLRPHQATPCRLGFNGSWPPIYQPADPSEWSSSRLSWRLWGVWLKTPSSSFAHWGRPLPRESAPWTRQLTPRSARSCIVYIIFLLFNKI